MDRTHALRKLQRGIASFAVVAVIASLSVVSSVSAFSDVKESDWYFESVQELVDAGVIDGEKDKFNPGTSLNRAEAAKIAVVAAGVAEEDLVNPDKPSFTDVPKSLWDGMGYKYVETAKSLGYVKGDDGKTTFRPGANINRAEFSKIIGLALELEKNTDGGPHFKDVKSADWFYDPVETAYHWSVVSGYEGGVFKPNAPILRSEMAKMTVSAMNPEERAADEEPADEDDDTTTPPGDTTTPPTPAPVVPGSDVSVALASDGPAASTHASGTAYNNALKFNVTAGSSADAKITGVTLTRGGISVDSNLSGVAVFDSAGKRHGNFLTFSENKAVVTFSSDPIVVGKGKTEAVWVKTNVSGTSGTYQISVAKAEDVTTDGGKVTGSFPVTGPTFQLANGATTVGALTVDAVLVHNNGANDVTAVNINLGTKDQDITKFRFAAGANEDIKINKLALYNNGNSNDGDIENIRLVAPDGTILSTVAQAKDRNLTFDLSASPYVITKGNTRDLTVRVDVKSGSTRTARFVIQNDYDVEVVGASTLSGILATAATTVDGAFPIGDSSGGGASCTGVVVCINKITVNSGTLLFAKSSDSPTGNVAAGGTNLVIGKWDVTAQGEDMELRQVTAVLTWGTVPTGSFKIKVGDQTVYSSSTFGATSPTTSAVTLSTYPVLKAGVKTTISYVIDVGSSTASGITYSVSMNPTQVKRLSTNDLVAPGTNATTANTLTVATASLSASKNSAFNDTTIVAGLTDAKIGSFNLNASSTEDVTVSSVTVALTGTNGVTNISNLKLMSGTTQLGSAVTTPAASNVFSISGFKILKGATATVDVYLTSTSSVTSGNTQIASLSAVGASGASSSVTITATGLTATGQTITYASAGTLTVTLDATNTPVGKILHSGMVDETLLAVRLTSNNAEDIKISNIQVQGTNADNTYKDLKLFVGATQQGSTTQLVKSVAAFSGLALTVPKDSTITLLVKGSTNLSGTVNSQSASNLSIGHIEATGVSGGSTIKPGTTLNTTWTSGNPDATTGGGIALTVGSTVGFHAGDIVYVASDNGTGGAMGMVAAEPLSTTQLFVNTTGALTNGANGTVSKLASGASVSGAGTPVKAGSGAFTVTAGLSTKGFVTGDAVMVLGGTKPEFGFVAAVTATTLTVNTLTDSGAATRITKIGSDTLMTSITATTALTAATATDTTVTSTSGFNVGDFVLVQDTTANGSVGLVTAVGSATGITLGLRTNVTPTTATGACNTTPGACLVRVGAINPSTSLVTRVSSTGDAVIAATAHTMAAGTTGFGVGDVVLGFGTAATGLAIFGNVTAVAATSLTVKSASASASVITRFTRLPGAAAAGNALILNDAEPTVTVNSTFAGGSTNGGSGQTVGMFDVKADGDRNMTLSSVNVQSGGSNLPFHFVTSYELWNGGARIAANTSLNATISAAAAGNVTTGTSLWLCFGADNTGTTAAGELYAGAAGASNVNVQAVANKIAVGDTIVLFKSTTEYATAQVLTKASETAGSDCGEGTNDDIKLTFAAAPSVTGSTALTGTNIINVKSFNVLFDTNSATPLATQTITAGSTLTLTVKADTTSVKSGVASGTTNYNVKIPGTAGPFAVIGSTSVTNAGGLTWGYTPSGSSTALTGTTSDSYPVSAPTLVY